eukprot:6107929-Alexandrium_andersonii.AAC.1
MGGGFLVLEIPRAACILLLRSQIHVQVHATRVRRWYGARPEAAPGGFRNASVECAWPHVWSVHAIVVAFRRVRGAFARCGGISGVLLGVPFVRAHRRPGTPPATVCRHHHQQQPRRQRTQVTK